jgi:hypothetical protein
MAIITIDIQETLLPYNTEDYERWRNPEWWESGQWKGFLPESEWHRVAAKFRIQAVMPGNHFVETLQMRALASEGLKWQYEDANFFDESFFLQSIKAVSRSKVHALMLKAYGQERLRKIATLAGVYRRSLGIAAKKPDLFVFREEAEGLVPVRFVECKFKDSVKEDQLLGLALLQKVFDTSVQIIRYVEENRQLHPMRYQRTFSEFGV